jgi:hypothetical protein
MDSHLSIPSATDQINVKSASHSNAEYAPQSKSIWHRPILTRVDIKRTMGNPGSAIDLQSGSAPT